MGIFREVASLANVWTWWTNKNSYPLRSFCGSAGADFLIGGPRDPRILCRGSLYSKETAEFGLLQKLHLMSSFNLYIHGSTQSYLKIALSTNYTLLSRAKSPFQTLIPQSYENDANYPHPLFPPNVEVEDQASFTSGFDTAGS